MLPNVYFFNPTCEYAVANGTVSWQPNRLLQKMEEDLELIPFLFSKKKDFLIVRKLPSKKFQEKLSGIFNELPQFVSLQEASTNPGFLSSPKNRILPWGWSPATHHLLAPLKEFCSPEFKQSPVFTWKEEHRYWMGKNSAAEISRNILHKIESKFLINKDQIAVKCKTIKELETLLKKWGKMMVKAPWSTSGRGLQPVTQSPIHPSVKNRINGIIRNQGFIMAEPIHNKILDLAFQFKCLKGKITFEGISFFETDEKGQYQGNFLNGLPGKPDSRISEILNFAEETLVPEIIKVLIEKYFADNFEGYFGIDSLLISDNGNFLQIHPCLETNLRYNMGTVALEIEQLLLPESKGNFGIYYQPGLSFSEFSNKMEVSHPVKKTGKKIISGFIPLTPTDSDAQFGAFINVIS